MGHKVTKNKAVQMGLLKPDEQPTVAPDESRVAPVAQLAARLAESMDPFLHQSVPPGSHWKRNRQRLASRQKAEAVNDGSSIGQWRHANATYSSANSATNVLVTKSPVIIELGRALINSRCPLSG
jgi:hypothetical protein